MTKMEGPVRVFGKERHGVRPSLQHNALHLMKYVGELAAIAEDADHDNPMKRQRAKDRAKAWFEGERRQNLADHYTALLADLTELAFG